MSLYADNTLISNREMLVELVMTPLRALGNTIIQLAENNARTKVLQAIMALPEEELRAQGISRAELIKRNVRHDV